MATYERHKVSPGDYVKLKHDVLSTYLNRVGQKGLHIIRDHVMFVTSIKGNHICVTRADAKLFYIEVHDIERMSDEQEYKMELLKQ